MNNSRERIQEIKNSVSLLQFCLDLYPNDFKQEGRACARSTHHSSLIITEERYFHNSSSNSGDIYDYLVKFRGLSFEQAVEAVNQYAEATEVRLNGPCPEPDRDVSNMIYGEGNTRRAYAYLCKTRKIHPKVVRTLFTDENFALDGNNNLCFFGNNGVSWCEINGTLSDIRFKGLARDSVADGYFYFPEGLPGGKKRELGTPLAVAVCESAIDALSLWELTEGTLAVTSMAGLKPRTFEKIKADFPKSSVIIAVDRDEAGDKFCEKFPDSQRLVPQSKDWNEDLLEMKGDLNE